ncbi:MAG: ATP-binding cassette domain-containing protein [Planctomycetota bacterium]|nr:ATP-binding cassette domain-containing protein [Planctomycetota bacterium]
MAPGEFLGVVGPNGAGKTTLFQTLLGRRPALAGSFRWGPTAQIGTLGQHEEFPDEGRTPLQYLQDANLGADDQDRRDKLGAMLFSGEEAMKPIRVLSGGEKKRLMLTRLLLEGHNVLLLDEPTNHLDIQSAETVTLALSAYPGSVLAISHDRHFLDETADRVLWLEEGEWRLTRGGFAEAEAERDRLRREREEAGRRRTANAKPALTASPAPARTRKAPCAGWSVARLEKKIIANENRLAEIQAGFADPAVIRDGGRLRRLREEMAGIAEEQAGLEAEYAKRG